MKMKPRFEELPKKMLLGKSTRMSLVDNKTRELWQSFMTEKSTIKNTIETALYSVQVYDSPDYFRGFDPHKEFTKFAGIEITNLKNIPNGFKNMTLEKGLYAVFLHKGSASEFPKTAQYIFNEWLPNSSYRLDHRPHFELLGKKYKNNDSSSEEEVWIPIEKRT